MGLDLGFGAIGKLWRFYGHGRLRGSDYVWNISRDVRCSFGHVPNRYLFGHVVRPRTELANVRPRIELANVRPRTELANVRPRTELANVRRCLFPQMRRNVFLF